jgi:outer membrane lipoprotein-sorting protein
MALLAAMLLGPACAVRQREALPPAAFASNWKNATLAELVEQVRDQQEAIETFQATVDIEPSVTRIEEAEVVHYRDVRAFILIRRPGHLRMIGLYPVARTTAFDMVSDGDAFGLYVPSRNRFIVGNSREGRRSESALENLRPQHILDALLWEAPEPDQEQAVLEVRNEGLMSYYIVHVLRSGSEGNLVLARNLWFERRNLSLERLQIFDATGEEVTAARYHDYGEFSGIPYPQKISIDRPKDRYGLALTVTKLEFNLPLGDEKFELKQPPGTELRNLEEPSGEEQANNVG